MIRRPLRTNTDESVNLDQVYFKTYSELFESTEFSELKPEEAFTIATLIETDFVFRLPTIRDALNYHANGNKVFAYLFAVEGQWGHYVNGKPLFPGKYFINSFHLNQ